MFTKPEDFTKAAAETATFLAGTAFESIERLTALNLNTTRYLIEASCSSVTALFGAKDPQAFLSLQTGLAQLALEKGVDHSRNVYEITSQTKDKYAKAVEAQIADVNGQVSGLVQKALDNAPAGSEIAVAAVKSAIAAANDAYDGLNKAAKQVTEIAEANIAAATTATINAAAKASKAA